MPQCGYCGEFHLRPFDCQRRCLECGRRDGIIILTALGYFHDHEDCVPIELFNERSEIRQLAA